MSSESPIDPVGATMVSSHGNRPVRTYPSGRICQELGCHARLSIYNPSTHCGLHPNFEVVVTVGAPTVRHSHRGQRHQHRSKMAA